MTKNNVVIVISCKWATIVLIVQHDKPVCGICWRRMLRQGFSWASAQKSDPTIRSGDVDVCFSRREQTALNRFLIGHSCLTHVTKIQFVHVKTLNAFYQSDTFLVLSFKMNIIHRIVNIRKKIVSFLEPLMHSETDKIGYVRNKNWLQKNIHGNWQ